ncbi:hypothetical protein KL932_003356 [Ogataea haglerorum]|nr:hypothetical protein KL932_003356 [Ogataea haglerorum]
MIFPTVAVLVYVIGYATAVAGSQSLSSSRRTLYREYKNQLDASLEKLPSGNTLDDEELYDNYIKQSAGYCQVSYCLNDEGGLAELKDNQFIFPDQLVPYTPIDYKEKFVDSTGNTNIRYNLTKLFDNVEESGRIITHGGGEGYMLLDHKLRTINIVFRGTRQFSQWYTNLHFKPGRYRPVMNSSAYWDQISYSRKKVLQENMVRNMEHHNYFDCSLSYAHAGFTFVARGMALQVHNELFKWLQEFPDYRVLVTGHSMGGALAQMTSLDLHILGIDNFMVSFNAPSVFSHTLAAAYNSLVDQSSNSAALRVYHFYDLVPRILPYSMYRHVGVPIVTFKRELPHAYTDFRVSANSRLYSSSQELELADVNETSSFLAQGIKDYLKELWRRRPEVLDPFYHRHLVVFFAACNEC